MQTTNFVPDQSPDRRHRDATGIFGQGNLGAARNAGDQFIDAVMQQIGHLSYFGSVTVLQHTKWARGLHGYRATSVLLSDKQKPRRLSRGQV